ncbi:hypothetical protein [Sunxiuqinia elliptica]|uniref:Uncharacterized protein n=1 Tax=Sunxiuqinia elliptica TaxID=655355 RepID=A0A1I2JL81_9BACT|nr:hypothetical protein [Sunxiuqinia elliptica]SFF54730.1 hypothetical protein SAMN05216283_1092 [Sunxiuqinia elliptica]
MNLDNEYLYLPEKYWNKHKQCELFVRQIEEFIVDETYNELRYQKFDLESENDLKEDEHIFDYLLRKEKFEEHDNFVRKSLVDALIIDVCYFLQEALAASKRKRLTVTFSLLRKPFVYHLPVFLRLLFDDEFLNNFNNKETFDVNYLKEEKKKELIKESLSLLLGAKSLTEEEIYEWIFNQNNPDSLINLTNKALHLSTTRNKNNKTEIQNLNFIFSNQDDIENLWSYLYTYIPILLLYLVEVIEPLVFAMIDLPENFYENRLKERILIMTKNVC